MFRCRGECGCDKLTVLGGGQWSLPSLSSLDGNFSALFLGFGIHLEMLSGSLVIEMVVKVSTLLVAPAQQEPWSLVGSLASFVRRQKRRWNRRVKTGQRINLTNAAAH